MPDGWPSFILSVQKTFSYMTEIRAGWPRWFPSLVWNVPALRRAYTVPLGRDRCLIVVWYYNDVLGGLQHLTSSRHRDAHPDFPETPFLTAYIYRRGRTLFRRNRIYPIAYLRFDGARTCTHAVAGRFDAEPSIADRMRALALVVVSGVGVGGLAQLRPANPRTLFWGVAPLAIFHFTISCVDTWRVMTPSRWIACFVSSAVAWSLVWLVGRAWF